MDLKKEMGYDVCQQCRARFNPEVGSFTWIYKN
jgi:hypothetical protein